MDNTQSIRYKLALGKFRVSRIEKAPTGFRMSIHLPGLGQVICHIPFLADVREGDLLTLYTEILGAPSQPTPEQ